MKKTKQKKDYRVRIPYDAEERYAFFVERKIVTPQPFGNKKKKVQRKQKYKGQKGID